MSDKGHLIIARHVGTSFDILPHGPDTHEDDVITIRINSVDRRKGVLLAITADRDIPIRRDNINGDAG